MESLLVYSDNGEVPSNGETSDQSESDLLFGRFTPGIIFNTSNILLDLSAYQSGVGFKLKAEDYALRGLFNLNYDSSDDMLETDIGITYEHPFFSGRVAPYWGGAVTVGYSLDRDKYDSENWTEYSDITGSLSAVFGTEVYVFDFLSLFAEYSIGLSFTRSTVTQSSAGEETDDTTFNFSLGTGLGNTASIGIVIYLEKSPIDNSLDKVEND